MKRKPDWILLIQIVAGVLIALTILMVMFIVTASNADAHTTEQIEAYEQEWVERMNGVLDAPVPESGLVLPADLDPYWQVRELITERSEFRLRHTCHYYDLGCPAPAVVTASVSSPSAPSSPSVPWNVEAGVEQWRGLVAAYFPAPEVDRALCIMWHESRGDPNAYNASTATGLMQVKSFWAESFGYTAADLFDPAINLQVAAGIQATSTGWGHWAPYNRGLCR